MKRQHILLSAIVISLLLLQLTFAASPRYEITDLRSLGGGYSCAYAINEAGQVVGTSATAGHTDHAFLWDRTHGMIDLGGVPGGRVGAEAYGINDFGEVVGYANSDDGSAFIWDSINAMRYLDGIGDSESTAYAINSAGQVVGIVFGYPNYGFLWEDGVVADLGFYPSAINNAGQVVGDFGAYGTRHAVLWDEAHGVRDLGTLGGRYSEAFAINDAGQVVGYSEDIFGEIRGFLWDSINGMIDLSPRYPAAINNAGQMVGSLRGGGSSFYWDSENGIIELRELLPADSEWSRLSASDINNRGQIVGLGITDRGEYHAFLMTPVPPKTIYVDANANGLNTGSSWADAFNYLQDALAAAYSGDEIRVAQGIYKPDQGTNQTPGDRTATFQLKNGVAIKGGYAGEGTPDPNARDIQLYETILTGDLNGNDIDVYDPADLLYEPTRRDNTYHVVTGSGTDETAVLDGFIITAGNANHPWEALWRRGGGMYNSGGSPTLTNCKFGANSAVGGGAIYITGEFQGTFTDCVFENNAASKYGGAIYLTGTGELNIIRCEFRDGSAERGGAIYSYASLVLSQCILVNNQAKYAGAINTDGDITLTNCLLANNHALVWGGALSNMMNTSRSVNCTFVGNSANFGGAISSNIECDTIAINSIFWNNTAQTGSQIATSGSHGGSTLTVNYCDIENLLDGLYVPSGCTLNWGEDNINAEPLFADSDNGDYRLSASSPCVDVGDSNFIAEPNETDLDGKPRVLDGDNDGVLVVDMGAYEYRFTISAEARIIPKTINLASKGNWITSYIWLPEEYNVADIEPNSVFLDDEIQPEQFSVDEQQQIATARFSREKVQAILNVGDVELTITGQLTDGTVFEGTDTIKVIDKARKK